MPSLRRIAAYRILAAALAACLVVPAIGLQGGVALAARVSTPAIEAKRLQASRAQAKLDDLADQLEQRYQELSLIHI